MGQKAHVGSLCIWQPGSWRQESMSASWARRVDVGLIVRPKGRAYFTHATSDRGKGRMTIIDRPISDYLKGSSKHAGIVICRPFDIPPSPLWKKNVAGG